MLGKLFFLDKGLVQVRNAEGVEVVFHSPQELEKYYSGTIDLSEEHYIDYEPHRRIFFYNNDPQSLEPLTNIYSQRPEVPEYEAVIADVVNMKARLDDIYFGLSLEEARQVRKAYLKNLTYGTIMKHMPEWKQVRWNEYLRVYEKLQSGAELTATERFVYDGFPEKDQTHDYCYQKVSSGLQWLLTCVRMNNDGEASAVTAASVDELREQADPQYPQYPKYPQEPN